MYVKESEGGRRREKEGVSGPYNGLISFKKIPTQSRFSCALLLSCGWRRLLKFWSILRFVLIIRLNQSLKSAVLSKKVLFVEMLSCNKHF